MEFAFVMLPLLYLVFGIMQYGLYFWSMQGGADTARYAARLAAVGDPSSCAGLQTAVRNAIGAVTSDKAGLEVTRTFTKAGSTVAVGDTVEVSVIFDSYDLNLPFIPIPDDGVVTSGATARVDYLPAPPYLDCADATP
ncbi:hypothetical protein ASG49_12115 [Marmoricola sp. Leaf446]|uniref:TadE/TadG family type IV pilus assembly protein n=1 Tax=Marmoricola sp. Leaf446 TaxID=1736379 RepID=UPI0006FB57E1|nr:TadE/TadG family type IV pilus assembly protein [Marmoricola sp. Leaf446]KQT91082.1 hypothetical protein ASG49_12115 [Marmoricola sp. Leaf446]